MMAVWFNEGHRFWLIIPPVGGHGQPLINIDRSNGDMEVEYPFQRIFIPEGRFEIHNDGSVLANAIDVTLKHNGCVLVN